MNVCVLGATGFIGGQIARAAVARGWSVRAARRRVDTVGAIGDLQVQWVPANLRDAPSLAEAMRGCEVLFHAAGAYPDGSRHIDIAVAEAASEMHRVLDAARTAGVRRVIYTSTLTTVERKDPSQKGRAVLSTALDESSFYIPGTAKSAYYDAKYAMEQIALDARDIDVVSLLPTAVFGPGDIKPTTSAVLRDAALGKFPVYFDATLNCVDGRDVAASHMLAVEKGRPGQRYILGGHNLPLYAVLATVMRVMGKPPPRLKLSRGLLRAVMRATDALPFVHVPDHMRAFEFWGPMSSAKAVRELGHTTRAFDQTVRDTLAWFKLL